MMQTIVKMRGRAVLPEGYPTRVAICGHANLTGYVQVDKVQNDFYKVTIQGTEKHKSFIKAGGSVTFGRKSNIDPNVVDIDEIFPGLNNKIYQSVSRKHFRIYVTEKGRAGIQDLSQEGTNVGQSALLGRVVIPIDKLDSRNRIDVIPLNEALLTVVLMRAEERVVMWYNKRQYYLNQGKPFTIGTNEACDLRFTSSNTPKGQNLLRYVGNVHCTLTVGNSLVVKDESLYGTVLKL